MKTKLIIFEGGDCCGKTTMLDKVFDTLNTFGYKCGKWKFPNYDGLYGQEILDHLKNFKVEGRTKDKIFKELMDFSEKQYLNKLATFDKFIKWVIDGDYDYVLLDRFTLSQYCYDAAWFKILDTETWINNIDKLAVDIDSNIDNGIYYTRKVIDNLYNRASLIMNSYRLVFPKIYTFIFGQNPYVKAIVNSKNTGRRVDKYDSFTDYQEEVNRLMQDMAKDMNLCGHEAYIIDPKKMMEIREGITDYNDYNHVIVDNALFHYTDSVIKLITHEVTKND